MKKILLLVEGVSDIAIITQILNAAKIPLNRFRFQPIQGKNKLLNFTNISETPLEEDEILAILIDLDSIHIEDAKKQSNRIKEKLPSSVEIFFAIPQIESWALADDKLILQETKGSSEETNKFERLPFPDEILYPKTILQNIIRKQIGKDFNSKIGFLSKMNISRATSRSPSLKLFLEQISNILGLEINEIKDSLSRNIDKKIFINLIKEVSNSETIMYKTLDGFEYSAEQLIKEIENGSDLGIAYSSDVLRIARDFLKRAANKKI